MRSIILSLAAAICLATSAFAQDSDPAIEDVIQQQFDAFLADDFETAFTFASPTIKGMFGSPGRFGEMVKQGYPMVWRPADVNFLDQTPRSGRIYQKVLVVDGANVPHVLEYEMIPTSDGWQINGVRLLQAPPVGA